MADLKTGDTVFHAPSGETWVVAYADPERDELAWCGWPPGHAKLRDCKLTESCSADESLYLLRKLAGMKLNREEYDYRKSYAIEALGEMDK